MSGWNRQRASSTAARRDPLHRRAVLLTAALVGGGICFVACGGYGAATSGVTARLVYSDSLQPSAELVRFLREDQAWVNGLPADLMQPPALSDMEGIRQWVRRVATPLEGVQRAGTATGAAQELLGRDLISLLRDRWLERGYLDVSLVWEGAGVRSEAGAGGSNGIGGRESAAPNGPLLLVKPGPAYRLRKLVVGGRDLAGRDRLLRATLPKTGDRFRAASWAEAIARLLAGAGELGYPFARWMIQRVEVSRSEATVDLEAMLLPGLQAYFGVQTSNLPGGRGHGFLARASGLRRGERYRESALRTARRRLQERGLYSQVGEPVVYLTTGSDTVGIHWPVVPRRRANRLGVVLGFSQGRTGEPGRLSGQVNLFLPNLAGTGRRLQAAWSDDGQERTHFGFGYLEPLAFGTPLDAEIGVDHEVMTGLYTRFRVDSRWRLPVVAAWGIEVGLGWDRSTFVAGELERTTRWRARGAFLRRRSDLTRSGWAGLFAIETARRQATARSDSSTTLPSVGRAERQRLLEFDLSGEMWLGSVWSLAGRGTFREVRGEGMEVPLSEQYRFGGARTVRGYREDEFRGEQVLYGSVELRIGRAGGSRLYTFWDMGYFEFSAPQPTLDDPERRDERRDTVRGFGMGLQAHTPGGDISLAIGFPGNVSFDDAKLHVSLLEAF